MSACCFARAHGVDRNENEQPTGRTNNADQQVRQEERNLFLDFLVSETAASAWLVIQAPLSHLTKLGPKRITTTFGLSFYRIFFHPVRGASLHRSGLKQELVTSYLLTPTDRPHTPCEERSLCEYVPSVGMAACVQAGPGSLQVKWLTSKGGPPEFLSFF